MTSAVLHEQLPETQVATPSRSKWVHFTPWKAFVGVSTVGLLIVTLWLVDWLIPGEMKNATTRQVNGVVEFSITSMKSAWMFVIFFVLFIGYPTLLTCLLYDRLRAEQNRSRGEPKSTNSLPGRIWKIIAIVVAAPLLAMIVWILAQAIVIQPLLEVHRVTIRGGDVRIESLYWTWEILRRDVNSVDVNRDVGDGNGGPRAEHRAEIVLRNGERFRSTRLDARPPGGQEDRRYEIFFGELRAELTK
jgi:hypothetical protein